MGRKWYSAGAGTFVCAMSMALCLVLACAPAYAADETEMTDGFVPVISGSGGGGDSSQPNSQGGDAGGDESQGASTNGSSSDDNPSEAETELSGDADGRDGGDPSGSQAAPSGGGMSGEGAKSQGSSQGAHVTEGIRLDDGSTVSVDDDGRLVLVNPAGNTRVLDGSRTYSVEADDDGAVTIRGEGGDLVEAEGASVSFVDSNGDRVMVDAAADSAKPGDVVGASGRGGTGSGDEAHGGKSPADQPASQHGILAVAVVVVIAAAVVLGIVFWRRKARRANR